MGSFFSKMARRTGVYLGLIGEPTNGDILWSLLVVFPAGLVCERISHHIGFWRAVLLVTVAVTIVRVVIVLASPAARTQTMNLGALPVFRSGWAYLSRNPAKGSGIRIMRSIQSLYTCRFSCFYSLVSQRSPRRTRRTALTLARTVRRGPPRFDHRGRLR